VRLHLAVDSGSEVPLYRQIAQRVEEGVEAGRLPPGGRLPTVRALADSLSVARVTVHHAYALLRELGLVESTVGRGTFIRESAGPSAEPATRRAPSTLVRERLPADGAGREAPTEMVPVVPPRPWRARATTTP